MEREYKEQDIYDYMIAKCVNFTKAIDNIVSRFNNQKSN
jgi:hypothetical protein